MEEVQRSKAASLHNIENQIGKLMRMIMESLPINKSTEDARAVDDPLFLSLQKDSQTEVDSEEVQVLNEKLDEAKEEKAITTKEELKEKRCTREVSRVIYKRRKRSLKTIRVYEEEVSKLNTLKKRRLVMGILKCIKNTCFKT
ncbi:hypothetical protein M9H77_29714 [Catharanthus roseus]|uniref:Uncharacterized protein n=1 Tax=Catharanthus roseus TaxID=4058 RepID=A0ACB9ZV67_CATRO|nr:hypothetical protein M9H77_29714 [Catharanthus roseus]